MEVGPGLADGRVLPPGETEMSGLTWGAGLLIRSAERLSQVRSPAVTGLTSPHLGPLHAHRPHPLS